MTHLQLISSLIHEKLIRSELEVVIQNRMVVIISRSYLKRRPRRNTKLIMDYGRGEKYKSRESSTTNATKTCGYQFQYRARSLKDDLRHSNYSNSNMSLQSRVSL